MKIAPITPIYPVKNSLQRPHRAAMSLRHDEHTVTDLHTGERFLLPEAEAWAKYKELNA